MSAASEYRYGIGADILESMNRTRGENGDCDLPLPNINRLAKVMQEYYKSEGHMDDAKEHGYKWRGSVDYWKNHISDIAEFMRKERQKFFIFKREQGDLKGLWKFVNKQEYNEAMLRELADTQTRVNTFNKKLEDGQRKWQLDIPHMHVQLLN